MPSTIDPARAETLHAEAPQMLGVGSRLASGLARLVLAVATGTPLRSVENVLPHPGNQETPYLGV